MFYHIYIPITICIELTVRPRSSGQGAHELLMIKVIRWHNNGVHISAGICIMYLLNFYSVVKSRQCCVKCAVVVAVIFYCTESHCHVWFSGENIELANGFV